MENKGCIFLHIVQESGKVSTKDTCTLENDGDKTQEASQVKRFKFSSTPSPLTYYPVLSSV